MVMYTRKLNQKRTFKTSNFGIESAQTRQPSLVDEFYYSSVVCAETGSTAVRVSHPLYMLFNQERLDRLGPAAVEAWLKQLETSGSTQLDALRSKCSDDDLLALVRSRHCQHPSELERYIRDLNDRKEFFNKEVAKIVAEQSQKPDESDIQKRENLETSET